MNVSTIYVIYVAGPTEKMLQLAKQISSPFRCNRMKLVNRVD